MSQSYLQNGNYYRVTARCIYQSKFVKTFFVRPKSSDNHSLNQQLADSKKTRKSRVVNERAIYRPPPARSTGILQETIKQNVDTGS